MSKFERYLTEGAVNKKLVTKIERWLDEFDDGSVSEGDLCIDAQALILAMAPSFGFDKAKYDASREED